MQSKIFNLYIIYSCISAFKGTLNAHWWATMKPTFEQQWHQLWITSVKEGPKVIIGRHLYATVAWGHISSRTTRGASG